MEHLNAGLKEISVAVLQSIHTCKCTYAILWDWAVSPN
jgi:hypothetical protein